MTTIHNPLGSYAGGMTHVPPTTAEEKANAFAEATRKLRETKAKDAEARAEAALGSARYEHECAVNRYANVRRDFEKTAPSAPSAHTVRGGGVVKRSTIRAKKLRQKRALRAKGVKPSGTSRYAQKVAERAEPSVDEAGKRADE